MNRRGRWAGGSSTFGLYLGVHGAGLSFTFSRLAGSGKEDGGGEQRSSEGPGRAHPLPHIRFKMQ